MTPPTTQNILRYLYFFGKLTIFIGFQRTKALPDRRSQKAPYE